MTIEKAIKILSHFLEPRKRVCNDEGMDAIRLGIEALERVVAYRESLRSTQHLLLPGETKEAS